MAQGKPRLLAVASAGGHWVQLLRMRAAFADFDVAYVSTSDNAANQVEGHRFHTISDASRFKLKPFIPMFAGAWRIMWRERPQAVITTGAAPGLPFLIFGRLMGCRTLWIDSIANAERLSSSGRIARRIAHRCISQWPDVAEREGVPSWGRVI